MWPPRDRNDWLAVVFGGVSIAALIAGFLTAGSPGRARAERLDAQRMEAVYATASALNCYHRTVEPIGQDLSLIGKRIEVNRARLQNEPNCWTADWRTDPVTQEPFALSWFGPDTLRLCAQFTPGAAQQASDTAIAPGGMRFAVAESPPDASGRQCFTVDLKKVPE